MNVSLTPELETYVNKKVKSGRYNSASEVMRAGLRAMQDEEEVQRIKLDALRRDIMLGVEQIRNGQSTTLQTQEDFDNFAASIKGRGRERIEARLREFDEAR